MCQTNFYLSALYYTFHFIILFRVPSFIDIEYSEQRYDTSSELGLALKTRLLYGHVLKRCKYIDRVL
jgi:hypothetical protein